DAGDMDDRVGACGSFGNRGRIENIVVARKIEPADLVAVLQKLTFDRRTDPAAISRQQYFHDAAIPSTRCLRSSPPRTRRKPRIPRPASVFTTEPVMARPSRREAHST